MNNYDNVDMNNDIDIDIDMNYYDNDIDMNNYDNINKCDNIDIDNYDNIVANIVRVIVTLMTKID